MFPGLMGIIMVQAQILATAKLGRAKAAYGKIYPPSEDYSEGI
jgi:hypothetical protein